MSQFSVPLATIDDFADRTGAERVVALLDRGDAAPPVLLERLEDGSLQVTEDADPVGVARDPAALPVALGDLRSVPASALSADPEAGELAALGGRSVATATFATRDADMPLTVAAREGEPVVLDIGGRQFSMPV